MDFPLQQDANIPIFVRDRLTGAPVISGVTVGAWSLYGPLSATALLTSSGATARGSGVYTVPVSAALLAVPGIYRLVYTVTAPTDATITAETLTFAVGPVVKGAWTMRDLLVSLIRSLGGSVRPSTFINAAVVTDPYWIGGGTLAIPAEEFNGSEVVLIDPSVAGAYADWFSGRVLSFDGTTGDFMLNRSTGLASDATGRRYALTNVGGTGFMLEHILEELRVAYDEVQPTMFGSVSYGLDIATNQLEYTLPDSLIGVSGVSVRDQDLVDRWDNIDGSWDILRDRRALRIDDGLGLAPGDTLRVQGSIRCELPKLGGGYTDMPGAWLRERVRFGLLASSPAPAHQRTAQVVYANLLRMPNPHRAPLASERRLS